jgi:hypothetical protein
MPKFDGSRKIPRNRHAGPDPASRTYQIYWIPAFTGMTGKQRKLTFYDFIKLIKIIYKIG